MTLEWWHWVVLGLILVLSELAIPVFFIIWFGLGALLVGLLLFIIPEMSTTLQVLLWTVASVGFVGLWFKILRPNQLASRSGTADAAIGEIGMLVSAVAPFQRGKVRFQKPLLGSDVWDCMSDSELPAGIRVRVSGIEGSVLKIEKTS